MGKAAKKKGYIPHRSSLKAGSRSIESGVPASRLPLAAAVSLVTFAVYLPSLSNGFVNWDDGVYVVNNVHIHSIGIAFFRWAFFDYYASNWHPLTWLFHALDYAMWHTNPLGHHLSSVILHAVNTGVVFFLATILLHVAAKETQPGPIFANGRNTHLTAAITALLFGLHPLHVESVAWVAERKDLLCGLFFLLSIVAYTRHVGAAVDRSAPGRVRLPRLVSGSLFASLLFFVLALLSKPMAVSLPFVLLILDWYPYRRIYSLPSLLSGVIEKAPFIALSLCSVVLTVLAQRSRSAMSLMEVVPFPARLLVAAKAVMLYLVKMVLPLNLIPFYPYPLNASLRFPQFVVPVLLLIAVSVFLLATRTENPAALSVWTYYVVTLLPVLGIVQVGAQSMADRYTYLPSIGPFLLLGMAAAWLWTNASEKQGKTARAAAICAGLVLFSAMGYLTVGQIAIWKDGNRLWSYVIEREPERIPFAYNNRGETFAAAGQIDKAVTDYGKAIALTDGNPAFRKSGKFAAIAREAYNNRGRIFAGLGQLEKAIGDYDRAIALGSSSYEPFNNRGAAFLAMGQFDKAVSDYDTAIALNPNSYEAHYGRGESFAGKGMLDKAIADYDKAIELNPSRFEAFNSRGVVLEKKGELEKALEDFNRAILVDKRCAAAYANRGNYYLTKGERKSAIADFRKACDLGNGYSCEYLRKLEK